METIHKEIKENQDSIAIGSASKDALVKIYGDYTDVNSFKKKIENAAEIKKYAKLKLSMDN